ncbi:MAG: hypothetical protein NTW21_13190 [Verrucomicrobia bacterium]|jgi:hypothetical protein|nr:hypothetical protein [Verrucomicrobiota bacterium]
MPLPNVSRRALLASAGLAMPAEVASGQENPTRIEHLRQKIYRSHRDMRGGPYPFAGTPKDIAALAASRTIDAPAMPCPANFRTLNKP